MEAARNLSSRKENDNRVFSGKPCRYCHRWVVATVDKWTVRVRTKMVNEQHRADARDDEIAGVISIIVDDCRTHGIDPEQYADWLAALYGVRTAREIMVQIAKEMQQ